MLYCLHLFSFFLYCFLQRYFFFNLTFVCCRHKNICMIQFKIVIFLVNYLIIIISKSFDSIRKKKFYQGGKSTEKKSVLFVCFFLCWSLITGFIVKVKQTRDEHTSQQCLFFRVATDRCSLKHYFLSCKFRIVFIFVFLIPEETNQC